MEYEKIKELIDCMGKSALSSLDIEFPDGIKINMKKEVNVIANVEPQNTIVVSTNDVKETVALKEEITGQIVKSPMVGTFYAKPAPNAKTYVSLGETVKKGTVLCIVEAMKLMNEIESEYEGTIAEIYVKDGESVEYGKPLFRIV